MYFYVNDHFDQSQADQEYYTLGRPSRETILSFKPEAPIGYRLPINAVLYGSSFVKIDGKWYENHSTPPRRDSSKTAVVIPADCMDVVKGSDGKIYLTYENGTYREFADDGTVGPEIDTLP